LPALRPKRLRAGALQGVEWHFSRSVGPKTELAEGGQTMEGPLRGLLAGAAAWKFGGGCISTILVFIIVFWLLGYGRC